MSWLDDFRDDFYDEAPRRRSVVMCADGFCGGTDCARCFPGRSVDDEPDELPTASAAGVTLTPDSPRTR